MKNLLILAVAAAFFATPLWACDHEQNMPSEPRGMLFQKMDGNGDGAVSLDEFHALHAHMFSEIDTDGDGRLTAQEIQAHHDAMGVKMGQYPRGLNGVEGEMCKKDGCPCKCHGDAQSSDRPHCQKESKCPCMHKKMHAE